MKARRLSAPVAVGLSAILCAGSPAQKAGKPAPGQKKIVQKRAAETKLVTAVIGKPVNAFRLRDLFHEAKDGEKEDAAFLSLSDFRDKKIVLLYFMSEHCGTTRLYDGRIGALLQKYARKDVAVLGVRCSANDTEDGLRKWVEAKNFAIPLLNDADGKMTAFFRVQNTPNFAVIDKKGVLRYRGSFDDSAEADLVKKAFVPDAIAALRNGKQVATKENRSFG